MSGDYEKPGLEITPQLLKNCHSPTTTRHPTPRTSPSRFLHSTMHSYTFPYNARGLGFPNSGKKKAHKLQKEGRDTSRVSLGHPAGQTGVYRPVSQELPVIYYRKPERKGLFLPGHRPGVPRNPAIEGGFRNFTWFFLMCRFRGSVRLGEGV